MIREKEIACFNKPEYQFFSHITVRVLGRFEVLYGGVKAFQPQYIFYNKIYPFRKTLML